MPPASTASGSLEGSDSQSVSSSDYIRTATQNYISRSATVLGAANLTTKGKSTIQADVKIHGDYGAPIHIGRYCHIDRGVVVMPSVIPKSSDPLLATVDRSGVDAATNTPPGENEKSLPIIIGSHTRIGQNTRIHSLSIGSSVRVGSDCILLPRSKVHDCCVIEDGTVIPPDMVVPPFSRVRGKPGKIVGSLPECAGGEFMEDCVQQYLHFVRRLQN